MRKKQKQYKPSGIAPFMMTAGALVAVVWLASSSDDFGTVYTGAKTHAQLRLSSEFIANKLAGKPSKRSAPPEEPTRTEEPDDAPIPARDEPAKPVDLITTDLVKAVIKTESGGDCKAVSARGAIGCMQLMPDTAKELKVNPRNAKQNIEGGKRYLQKLIDKYGDETLALAAYNMGPGATDRWLKRGGKLSELPEQTRNYIAKVNLHRAVATYQLAQK